MKDLPVEVSDVIDECLTRESMVFIPEEEGATLLIAGQGSLPYSIGELTEICNFGMFYRSIAQLYELMDKYEDCEQAVSAIVPVLARTQMALNDALNDLDAAKAVDDYEAERMQDEE